MCVPAFGELLGLLLRFHVGRFHGLMTLHRLRVMVSEVKSHIWVLRRQVSIVAIVLQGVLGIVQAEMMRRFSIRALR